MMAVILEVYMKMEPELFEFNLSKINFLNLMNSSWKNSFFLFSVFHNCEFMSVACVELFKKIWFRMGAMFTRFSWNDFGLCTILTEISNLWECVTLYLMKYFKLTWMFCPISSCSSFQFQQNFIHFFWLFVFDYYLKNGFIKLFSIKQNLTFPEISCPAKYASSGLLKTISNRSNWTIS